MPTTPVARVLIRRSSDAVIGEHFVGRLCETPILSSHESRDCGTNILRVQTQMIPPRIDTDDTNFGYRSARASRVGDRAVANQNSFQPQIQTDYWDTE